MGNILYDTHHTWAVKKFWPLFTFNIIRRKIQCRHKNIHTMAQQMSTHYQIKAMPQANYKNCYNMYIYAI